MLTNSVRLHIDIVVNNKSQISYRQGNLLYTKTADHVKLAIWNIVGISVAN